MSDPSGVAVEPRQGALEDREGSGPLSPGTLRSAASVCGMQSFRNRWLEPATGAWTVRDPLGDVDSLNLYQVGLDDPLSRTDYSGLSVDYPCPAPRAGCDSSSISKALQCCFCLDFNALLGGMMNEPTPKGYESDCERLREAHQKCEQNAMDLQDCVDKCVAISLKSHHAGDWLSVPARIALWISGFAWDNPFTPQPEMLGKPVLEYPSMEAGIRKGCMLRCQNKYQQGTGYAPFYTEYLRASEEMCAAASLVNSYSGCPCSFGTFWTGASPR